MTMYIVTCLWGSATIIMYQAKKMVYIVISSNQVLELKYIYGKRPLTSIQFKTYSFRSRCKAVRLLCLSLEYRNRRSIKRGHWVFISGAYKAHIPSTKHSLQKFYPILRLVLSLASPIPGGSHRSDRWYTCQDRCVVSGMLRLCLSGVTGPRGHHQSDRWSHPWNRCAFSGTVCFSLPWVTGPTGWHRSDRWSTVFSVMVQ